jgi:hypothetical protein
MGNSIHVTIYLIKGYDDNIYSFYCVWLISYNYPLYPPLEQIHLFKFGLCLVQEGDLFLRGAGAPLGGLLPLNKGAFKVG